MGSEVVVTEWVEEQTASGDRERGAWMERLVDSK